ncbi:MAG: carboxymuconolactone decarboxylase family protein [Candidatus Nanopelagicales bacterium]
MSSTLVKSAIYSALQPDRGKMTDHHTHGKDTLADLVPLGQELRELIPEVYGAFARLSKAAQTPGALDSKTKEFIALALAIFSHCDGCIASHSRNLAKLKATEQEVAELIGVCIQMMGGPGTVYGPRAFAAFKSFNDPQ